MPELPEVETIRRGLAKNIINKKVKDFSNDWPKMINYPVKKFLAKIIGHKIVAVRRRAKMLILDLTDKLHILVHLKMTGQLVYSDKIKCVIGGHPIEAGYDCLPNKFTHATVTFTDSSHLYFNDIRKFGWLRLFTTEELGRELAKMELGPEPLSADFTLAYFTARLKKSPRKKIKQFLMEPTNLVGVGNIYSDEICFYAKVRPDRLTGKLTNLEIKALYRGIRKILEASIKSQGTTFSDYRGADGETGAYYNKLKVYGRYGEKCKVCGTEIKKQKIGGRTASFCPNCQK